ALAGTGIGPRPLAANRKRPAVTIAAIAPDVPQAGDVLLDLAAESTFDEIILVEDADDLRQFLFRQVLGATVRVDAGFLQDLPAVGRTNAIDIRKAHPCRLVRGDVHTCDTGHCLLQGSNRLCEADVSP